ncbi:Rcs stress response system protein RcsF [Ferrimonas pelagia]|uniref:Rcs stress response system protein RcsF n=1 Tax=Ferrimonas pelagia TaxID=1177826 RepID=A0ABP9EB57_9GAMM
MRLIPALSLLLLAGCSTDLSFSSNLDKDNFDDYFAAGQVKLLDTIPPQAKRLGLVEGQSCQSGPQYPIPTPAEARTDLRKQAAALGANAVQLQLCTELEPGDNGCLASMVCYGEALELPQ